MTQAAELEPNRLDTKTRILDAAERLFAQHGFAATSLRQITAEAKANLASVNYHFQNKESLILAVLQRKIGPINVRRLELLDAEQEKGTPVALPAIFQTFFQPLFEAEQTGVDLASFPRLLARVYGDDQENILPMFRSTFGHVIERYRAAIEAALPGVSGRDFALAMHFSIGCMAHYLAAGRLLQMMTGGAERFEWVDVVQRLSMFCAAGTAAMHERRAGQ